MATAFSITASGWKEKAILDYIKKITPEGIKMAHSGLLGNIVDKRKLQEIPLSVLRFFTTKNTKHDQWNFNAYRTIRI